MNNKMPLEGLIILKRLNKNEDEEGVHIKDTEFVFASRDYRDIIKKLVRFPRNKLSWLIVAEFKQNEDKKLEYSSGMNGLKFLQKAQEILAKPPRSILLN